jgi:hypothetical protein
MHKILEKLQFSPFITSKMKVRWRVNTNMRKRINKKEEQREKKRKISSLLMH